VLVARQLEVIFVGLGSRWCFAGPDLERVGGFRSIVDYLADDYELGRRIAGLGLRYALHVVVQNRICQAYDIN